MPEEMGFLPQLEYISCSYNHICSIDTSIGKLRHLRELKMASNKFELFPEELFSLRSLQLIDLSKNRISDIPSGIGKMNVSCAVRHAARDVVAKTVRSIGTKPTHRELVLQVVDLNLNDNCICTISNDISMMSNLQILRLQNNKLTLNAIPESLFTDSQVS